MAQTRCRQHKRPQPPPKTNTEAFPEDQTYVHPRQNQPSMLRYLHQASSLAHTQRIQRRKLLAHFCFEMYCKNLEIRQNLIQIVVFTVYIHLYKKFLSLFTTQWKAHCKILEGGQQNFGKIFKNICIYIFSGKLVSSDRAYHTGLYQPYNDIFK